MIEVDFHGEPLERAQIELVESLGAVPVNYVEVSEGTLQEHPGCEACAARRAVKHALARADASRERPGNESLREAARVWLGETEGHDE